MSIWAIPLLMVTTVMPSSKSTLRFISPPCRSPLKAGKKFSLGFVRTSWGGATSRRSRRSSALESSTVWSIESPAETATTSTRLLPRKPPRRNCVKLTQFLPLPQKQAFVSRSCTKFYTRRTAPLRSRATHTTLESTTPRWKSLSGGFSRTLIF